MFIYQLTYADLDAGLITRFVRNARGVKLLKRKWAKEFPFRELLIEERVEIPEQKQALIDWLNAEVTRTRRGTAK